MRTVPTLAAAFACACLLALPGVSQAQISSGPRLGDKGDAKPEPPPPPALPGAQTDNERVTPADKQATDVPPTEALFDAINRGDISSARDAIARGADLNGHNMLGMTPMELSVDLGRNNISFLLLSLRGADTRPANAAAVPRPAAKQPVQHAGRRPVAPVREAAEPTPRTPKMFAGDGGAPIPSAGFLGFDAGRTGTAR